MNIYKANNVINLSIEERYDYFIRYVVEFEEVWGVANLNGWATSTDLEKKIIIPFWPEQYFASICCTDQWSDCIPKVIPLEDFLNKWLIGMQNDLVYANIFYTPFTKIGLIVNPEVLNMHLIEEQKKYL